MHVFNLEIPDKPLTNIELSTYARELKIPNFRSGFMRDTLPRHSSSVNSPGEIFAGEKCHGETFCHFSPTNFSPIRYP